MLPAEQSDASQIYVNIHAHRLTAALRAAYCGFNDKFLNLQILYTKLMLIYRQADAALLKIGATLSPSLDHFNIYFDRSLRQASLCL